MDNVIYKYLFIIILGSVLLYGIFFVYSLTSFFSKEDNTTIYSTTLMCPIAIHNEHPRKSVIEAISECRIMTTGLRYNLLLQLKKDGYIKTTTTAQNNHIDSMIEDVLKNQILNIVKNDKEDIVALTQSWLNDKKLHKKNELKLIQFYTDQDKSTELLKIISDYLGVTKA